MEKNQTQEMFLKCKDIFCSARNKSLILASSSSSKMLIYTPILLPLTLNLLIKKQQIQPEGHILTLSEVTTFKTNSFVCSVEKK